MCVETKISRSCDRCGEPALAELAGFSYCKECLIIVLAAIGDRDLVGEVRRLPGSEHQARFACNVALYLMTAAMWRPPATFEAAAPISPG
jgi:hypothetical protein